jgi:LPXTG-motif cell wall-anchored protein
MVGFANPLTDAIVKQFPDKFGAATASTTEMPHTMPATGMDMQHNSSNNMVLALLGAGLLSVGGVFLLRRARSK